MRSPDDPVDRVLAGWRAGDPEALDDLFRLVYDELRVLAGRQLRRLRPGQTLGSAALVNELYLRFAARSPRVADRGHFMALAARAMRMVIVDYWRHKRAQKRGAQAPVSANLDDLPHSAGLPAIDLLALDEALRRLAQLDERQARVVDLRFFGGLTLDEIAGLLGVSERTAKREWQKARAFLHNAMRTPAKEGSTR
jgi:RNA polymerase sigma factor (TIGR02999 family)